MSASWKEITGLAAWPRLLNELELTETEFGAMVVKEFALNVANEADILTAATDKLDQAEMKPTAAAFWIHPYLQGRKPQVRKPLGDQCAMANPLGVPPPPPPLPHTRTQASTAYRRSTSHYGVVEHPRKGHEPHCSICRTAHTTSGLSALGRVEEAPRKLRKKQSK
jgi:hypothetical protein